MQKRDALGLLCLISLLIDELAAYLVLRGDMTDGLRARQYLDADVLAGIRR